MSLTVELISWLEGCPGSEADALKELLAKTQGKWNQALARSLASEVDIKLRQGEGGRGDPMKSPDRLKEEVEEYIAQRVYSANKIGRAHV